MCIGFVAFFISNWFANRNLAQFPESSILYALFGLDHTHIHHSFVSQFIMNFRTLHNYIVLFVNPEIVMGYMAPHSCTSICGNLFMALRANESAICYQSAYIRPGIVSTCARSLSCYSFAAV